MSVAESGLEGDDDLEADYDPEILFEALRERPGWKRRLDNWEYLPSTPPVGSGVVLRDDEELEPASISEDGYVHPPAVRFVLDEEADNRLPPRTAAEITGITHPLLGGEVISFSFDRDEDIVTRLEEIETWRWPTNLPSRTFGEGLSRCDWEPGHPDDLER